MAKVSPLTPHRPLQTAAQAAGAPSGARPRAAQDLGAPFNSIGGEAAGDKPPAFLIGAAVRVPRYSKSGHVIGIATFADRPTRYLVVYDKIDGTRVERWCPATDLVEALPDAAA